MTTRNGAEQTRRHLLRDASLTLVVILLAVAAFDDITTDRATTFTAEWVGLAVCGLWLGIVCWRLLRTAHRWLGTISSLILVAAIAGGFQIRPGADPLAVESLAIVAGLLWFLGLALVLAAQARRTDPRAA